MIQFPSAKYPTPFSIPKSPGWCHILSCGFTIPSVQMIVLSQHPKSILLISLLLNLLQPDPMPLNINYFQTFKFPCDVIYLNF